jgi:hypothetical protein
MKMDNLPIRAAFRDDKSDATIGTERLPIAHAGHGIETGDYDGRVGETIVP